MTNGIIAGEGGAAEMLGVPPSTLRSRMKKLGIKVVKPSALSLASTVAIDRESASACQLRCIGGTTAGREL